MRLDNQLENYFMFVLVNNFLTYMGSVIFQ